MPALNPDAVYTVISQIPSGSVASYGQVADLAGCSGHARGVGRLLSSLPPDTHLPWHRVVNAQGRITCPNHITAAQRLLLEGVVVNCNRINLTRFGWSPGR